MNDLSLIVNINAAKIVANKLAKKIVVNKLPPIVLATIILVGGFLFYKLFTFGVCLLAHNFDLKVCYDLNFSSKNLLSIINKISQLKP